jgi:hypothetical protein
MSISILIAGKRGMELFKAHRIPAQKIKCIDAVLKDIKYEVIIDRVIVQGIIRKEIYYVGLDSVVHYQAEDMPFSTMIDIAGAFPGLTADINIDIEKIIAHLGEAGCNIRQKLLLCISIRLFEGSTASFIGENSKQILLEGEFQICEPVPEVDVDYEIIVRREKGRKNCQQLLIQQNTELEYTAEKIVNIEAEIEGVRADKISNTLVLIQGNICKDIVYVTDSIVRHQREIVAFSIPVKLTEAAGEGILSPCVEIESLKFALHDDGKCVKQIIVLKACYGPELISTIRVVSSITGPEIITDTVMVEEEVVTKLDPLSTEKKVFPVVRSVLDPLNLLSAIEKEVIVLNIVDSGPAPVEVLVSVSV